MICIFLARTTCTAYGPRSSFVLYSAALMMAVDLRNRVTSLMLPRWTVDRSAPLTPFCPLLRGFSQRLERGYR